jgi:hypothetical protein
MGNDMSGMTEAAWSRLLAMMRDGTVVPVVGPRLLVDDDGTSLQARVATKLLADYGVEVPEGGLIRFREINEAVTLLKGKVDVQDLYFPICQAMADLQKQRFHIPKSLSQLAKISDFRMVVTLTPDGLLTQALQAANRAVNEVVHSPKLPTDQGSDLPADWQKPGGAVQVLYLFGKARPSPLFSIHDEDVLEYAHNVIISGSHSPRAFLSALQDRNLLLIGCNFPDWLSRFILRATRKGRLADHHAGYGWLVEPLGQEDPFIGFLGKYSPATSVLTDIEPADFVDELYRRWVAQHTPNGDGAPTPTERAMPESAMFFISYSRTTDVAAAVRLYETLRGLGVAENEIWFDRETLEPGDLFKQRILNGIRSCRYFIPLVSRAATQRDQAFVFREWNEATDVLPELNRTYLVPLVVDQENLPKSYRQVSVEAWVERGYNFGHAPEGLPDANATAFLRNLVRAARPNV